MKVKNVFSAKHSSIPEINDFINKTLEDLRIGREERLRQCLRCEDLIVKLIGCKTGENSDITVDITSYFGTVKIKITCPGRSFELEELKNEYDDFLDEEESDEECNTAAVRDLMTEILTSNLSIRNSRGFNICSIEVEKTKYQQILLMLACLFGGLLVGFIMKSTLPDFVAQGASEKIFESISTMFINALKMIVVPLVFFSIAASISSFGNLKLLGKLAIKVVGAYIVTSMIAICVGFVTYKIFPIGNPSLASSITDAASDKVEAGKAMSLSIRDVIVDIVPDNFVAPMLESNMLQIIFIAVLFGIAAAAVDEKYSRFKQGIQNANAIFSKMTAIIISFMPVAVFCSMATLIIDMDMANVATVALWLPVSYAGFALMIVVYLILLYIFTRLNPLVFIKKYVPAMLTAFTLSSSNATIPTSIKTLEEKIGVSKKVISFSIPLGATINMDGSCVMMMITVLFMGKIFGVSITGGLLLSAAISILMLSVGAPGVPGSALICLAFILPQVGIPAEAVSIIMGLYSINCMAQTVCNVTGDAVVSTIVAKASGLVNKDIYYSKE